MQHESFAHCNMKALFVVFFLWNDIFLVSANETSIILSLIKELEIRQCFVVYGNVNSLNPLSGENFLLKNTATAYISYANLRKYIEDTEYNRDGIGIILKENNLDQIERISQNLNLVGF